MTEGDRDLARERVIESMERSAEVYGLTRSAGRLYGVLYFADGPLSIPELVEETGYAKSTVSNVTRTLTRVGLVRRRSSEGGGRRVRFAAERDVWFVLQDVLRQYGQREVETTLRAIRRAESELPDDDSLDAVVHDRERVEDLRETYEDVAEVVRLASEYSASELREALEEYER
ncbi:DNA-binding transcriptional regulator GbsR, MarR family [Halorubrum aquaticum]|uniref:HTH-type transcriptional regulator n=1 Tax=Halorubrum aquaticum TaxID=387340 RepID=A0A1I2ZL56_9EURY|nr:MarR family transcriptional regulator [Halorubrum aquaticum]SFH38209.1 DNA-binding transcriptional regulator GbsR, MarR family [Halorubrum aquaticum]